MIAGREFIYRLGGSTSQLSDSTDCRFAPILFLVFVGLLSTAIGIGLIAILRDAATSRSVVIDPFDVPAGPATARVNGKIVAAGLLDVLRGIQSANRTTATAEGRQLANAWTIEISVEIPETGLSVRQIERVLKDHLGRDQHVEGAFGA